MTDPRAVVFIGPTLDLASARQILDVTYLPPVAQGDVLRLVNRPPAPSGAVAATGRAAAATCSQVAVSRTAGIATAGAAGGGIAAIGIIDGYFELVPSVWHKEILVAMARGIRVFGAASMGALRAAELHTFGMEGVGQIFSDYQRGVLEDDDEVAVAHGPADTGFVGMSVAMVDVRDVCRRATDQGAIEAEVGQQVVSVAKSTYYADRTWPGIWAAALAAGVEAGAIQALREFGAQAGESLKSRDARALLHRMGAFLARPWPPTVPPVTPEPTVFLANLQAEVEAGRAAANPTAAVVPSAQTMLRVGESVAVARKKVLLRVLARREASAAGIRVTEADLQAAADQFRREFGLLTRADFAAWFAAERVTDAEWREFLRDRCLVAQLERRHDAEITAGLAGYLHTATARLWHPPRDAGPATDPGSARG